ncbi:hypothetical protein SAMN02745702_01223 [Desulfobaculum bizertense DSM 18034]|uniref:Uncharacterized protein n=2 Tax=Desulfobaculum TaxID=1433996 RepID=A0A1T4VY18_9BACT|nr:hypothetical protein SAMN02745702_01223 [Desulfobaculum bizertense DSM 18034]
MLRAMHKQRIQLHPQPAFDLVRFLDFAGTSADRIPEDEAFFREVWDRWQTQLEAHAIRTPQGRILFAWLAEAVETEIDTLWNSSPHTAYLLHVLALDLIMNAASQLVPQIAKHGCAPVPHPHPSIEHHAKELGLHIEDGCILSRRYAMLTPMPWNGGCASCALAANCPRNTTEMQPSGMPSTEFHSKHSS